MADKGFCSARDLTLKDQIQAYFDAHHGQVLHASDVTVMLNVDAALTARLIDLLVAEGSIAVADDV